MTFNELVAALSKEIGGEIETDGDTCAVRTGPDESSSVIILLQGFDERGAMLMTADLGQPPPERLERRSSRRTTSSGTRAARPCR